MHKYKQTKPQQIGFLMGQGPRTVNPGQFHTHAPPYMFNPAPSFPPFPSYPTGSLPSVTPQVTPPGSGGLGGILQSLLSSKGTFDIQSILANTQKMIGIVNQVGPIVRNVSPMLQLLKGFGEMDASNTQGDVLTEVPDKSDEVKVKRRRRGTRRRKNHSSNRRKSSSRTRERSRS
jgi:hypothetical protein